MYIILSPGPYLCWLTPPNPQKNTSCKALSRFFDGSQKRVPKLDEVEIQYMNSWYCKFPMISWVPISNDRKWCRNLSIDRMTCHQVALIETVAQSLRLIDGHLRLEDETRERRDHFTPERREQAVKWWSDELQNQQKHKDGCDDHHIIIIIDEGSLNSKLPTIWRVEKQMKSREMK